MNYGSIRILTNPVGAVVSISGESGENKEITPLDIINIRPGIYNITLAYSGMNSYNFDTVVIDGKMTIVEFDFILQEVSESHKNLIGSDLVAIPVPPGMPIENVPNMPGVPGVPSGSGIAETITVENPSSNVPVPGMPTNQVSTATLDNVIGILGTINDNLIQQNNSLLAIGSDIGAVKSSIDLSSHRVKDQKWYDAENSILVSVPVKPDDNNSILYQYESINNVLGRNSGELDIVNEGPGILFIVTSIDGLNFKNEVSLLEGQKKTYDDIYTVGLEFPTANLVYKVTERRVTTVSGQQFSGSRYKDRRDRKGVIVFQDDYESPTIKCIPFASGLGTTARSLVVAYSGDFSFRMTTGANANDTAEIIYFHPDFHEQKVGIQIQFASASNIYDLHLVIDYFDGNHEYYADVYTVGGSGVNGSLVALDESGNNYVLVSGIPPDVVQMYDSIYSWNVMKLVVDLSTDTYISAEINGKKVNFNILLQAYPNISKRHIESTVFLAESNAIIYVDNYLFTEDET